MATGREVLRSTVIVYLKDERAPLTLWAKFVPEIKFSP
jgi:hypothetical protein